jgi:hypothetical protein
MDQIAPITTEAISLCAGCSPGLTGKGKAAVPAIFFDVGRTDSCAGGLVRFHAEKIQNTSGTGKDRRERYPEG